jgi:toxin YoeB
MICDANRLTGAERPSSPVARRYGIVSLIKDVQRDPFKGLGKPEPLKHEFKGCWNIH